MEDNRWQRIESLYHCARELEEGLRSAYLQEACGADEDLRREVESLLAHDRDAGSFLEGSAQPMARREEGGTDQEAPSAISGDDLHLEGTLVSHYRVLKKIGGGGMGEVYRAHDEHLDREVAIKVLPPGTLSDESSRKRFRKEALALSKLNHPNIATIHDFDTQQGVDLLVMEYIPGITLSEKLAGRPLGKEETVQLGMQLADGLEAAHEHGVVHRDLKPGNLRVTPQGRLKILDFGLATMLQREATPAAATISLTETRALAGTLPYMAPEQLRGQRADARSDLWAVGVVLYEMATGRRPFQGQTGFELSSAILSQAAPALPATVPAVLQGVIFRCLEKDPARRYQSAREVGTVLDAIQAGAGLPWTSWRQRLSRHRWAALAATVVLLLLIVGELNLKRIHTQLLGGLPQVDSLAVLPLENLSGDPEQDYLADGIHEALITDLAKLHGIRRLIARSSVMRYRRTQEPPGQIARELGVDALITGAVMRSGNRVQITAHLINASTEEQVWADRYERQFSDVLSLQNDVVEAITRAIRLQLTPQEQARLRTARPVNPETHEAYLKGMFYLYRRTPESYTKGMALLQQAIAKDPTDPLPYAGLALGVTIIAHGSGSVNPVTDFPRAREAARKALELDENSAEAHLGLATVKLYFDYDWAGAEKEFRRALEINPSLADAHAHYGWYLHLFGRNDEALAEGKKAEEVAPLSAIHAAWMGWMYGEVGQPDKAIEEARKALDLDPNSPDGLYVLSSVYADKGMFQEAIPITQKLAEINGDWKYAPAEVYAKAGRKADSLRLVSELEREGYAKNAFFLARIQTTLGNKEETFRALKAAYGYRHMFLPWVINDPTFPWRDDPRFLELRRRLNLLP